MHKVSKITQRLHVRHLCSPILHGWEQCYKNVIQVIKKPELSNVIKFLIMKQMEMFALVEEHRNTIFF